MTRVFGSMLLALLCLSTTAQADVSNSAQLTARGWQPFMELYRSGGSQQALAKVQRLLLINQATFNKPQIDPKLKALTQEMIAQLGDFELDNIYDLLPLKAGNRHLLVVNSKPTDSGFVVTPGTRTANYPPLNQMSATRVSFALTPLKRVDGYHGKMALNSNIGLITWPDIQSAVHATLLNLSEPAAISAPQSAIDGVTRWYPNASPTETATLSQLWTAFPASFTWISRISQLKSFYISDDSTPDIKHLHFVIQLDDKAFHQHFPKAATYVEKIRDFVNGTVVIKGVGGNWLTASVNTNTMTASVDFWTKQGHLVPSVHGKPNLHFPFSRLPDSFPFHSAMNLHFNALGVKVGITNFATDWHFKHTPKETYITGLLDSNPKVDVSGYALGFIPTALIKIFPVDIESTVNRFMTTLTTSNDGNGASLGLIINESGANGTLVHSQANGDVADSFFIRFLMRMFSKRTVPTADQTEALRHMARDFVAAVSHDLKRWSTMLDTHPELANVAAGNGKSVQPKAPAADKAPLR